MYYVRIKRDLPKKAGSFLKFGPIQSLSEAKVIARHESREPKTHWVKVVDSTGAVKLTLQGDQPYSANPAKRKGASKVYRKFQITKKAPTKRLVKRRRKNTEKGYFPNPKPSNIIHVVLIDTGKGFAYLTSRKTGTHDLAEAEQFTSSAKAAARAKEMSKLSSGFKFSPHSIKLMAV
jgi:hypothetical protein